MHIYSRRFVAVSACLLMGFTPVLAAAQPAPLAAAVQPAQSAPAAQPAPAVAVQSIKVPEGTEFRMRLEDAISSESAQEGDRFTISLDEDVPLSDGTVLRSGYRGVGEVVAASKNGAFGKKGKLNLRLEYVKVGDQRIRLRGQKASTGDGRVGAQIVGVVFIGVFAGFIKGKNTTIPKGTKVNAFSDQDVVLQGPLPPPPTDA